MCFLWDIIDWAADWVGWAASAFWVYGLKHPGTLLVVIGVAGEGLEILAKLFCKEWFKKHEHPIDIAVAIFWVFVVIGLMWEIPDAAKTEKEASNISSTNVLLSMRVEELRKKNDDFELRQLPRVYRFNFGSAGEAIAGFKGKKPNIELLYAPYESDAWQVAYRFKMVLDANGWRTSTREEKEDDIPPGPASLDGFGAPLPSRLGGGQVVGESGFTVIANPAFASGSSWIASATFDTNAMIMIPHTDNPVDVLWAAILAGGLGGGSGRWDPRLPLDVVRIVVPQKSW